MSQLKNYKKYLQDCKIKYRLDTFTKDLFQLYGHIRSVLVVTGGNKVKLQFKYYNCRLMLNL